MLTTMFRRSGPQSPAERPIDTGMDAPKRRAGIALALGGGAARGWAHIGVLRALEEARIPVSMIAGTSIGALVGGCYLAGRLDELENFALSLTRRGLLRFLDFSIGGAGLIGGMRLNRRLVSVLEGIEIEDLQGRFISVATDARSGHEVWLESGSLILAMRASYALPGVFLPVECGGRRLIDGALVNPVPVSICRAYEEPLVVAVNLNYDLYGRAAILRMTACETPRPRMRRDEDREDGERSAERRERFGIARSMVDAFNIIQERTSRSRLAGDPPDLSIHPRVRELGLSEFHRAREAIDLGYHETMRHRGEIERLYEFLPR